MPSSENYVRDLTQERKTSVARGEMPKDAIRHRARYAMVKKGLVRKFDGKDVDHKKPLSKGGSGLARSNLRVQDKSTNRSFARNSDGSIKGA